MNKLVLTGVALCFAGALDAAVTISNVQVRQLWPWNAKVRVSYELAGAEPNKYYDISLNLRCGGERLVVPETSVSGDRFSVQAGRHVLTWDPTMTAYTNRVALGDLEVSLSAVCTDALRYMIIDMSKGAANGQPAELWPVTYTNEIVDADGDGKWDDEYKLTKMVFRRVEPGTFTMGVPSTEWGSYSNLSDGSEKQHQVTFSKPFYMGVFEVTSRQFYQTRAWRCNQKYGKSESTDMRPCANYPYDLIRGSTSQGVDWPTTGHAVYDDPTVTTFSNVVNTKANNMSFLAWFRRHVPGLVVDLPTEAQWEYCCRAGSPDSFYNGANITSRGKDLPLDNPNIDAIARTKHNSLKYENGNWTDPQVDGTEYGPCDVGSYVPNDWGFYDMHGNVNEWCLDWNDNTALPDATDPKGVMAGTYRAYRGGGYSNFQSDARAGMRGGATPSEGWTNFGFRLAVFVD